jgi:hypothetical protein
LRLRGKGQVKVENTNNDLSFCIVFVMRSPAFLYPIFTSINRINRIVLLIFLYPDHPACLP